MKKIEKYDALDGVRTISAICILIVHIYSNIPYKNELKNICNFFSHECLSSFNVFLGIFMMISAFSISCGYFERISNGSFIEIGSFYKKRFVRTLPFFATLSIVDLIVTHTKSSLIECVANLTLSFGFLPNHKFSIIGVGWTLGVIFVFYLLYPFFVYCMKSRKRFFLLLGISIFYSLITNEYFELTKYDFLYNLIYFVVGCGLFLIKDEIKNCNRWIILIIMLTVLYFCFPLETDVSKVIIATLITAYAIIVSNRKTILSNPFMKVISKYSFEIYLSHMFVFRVLEKFNLLMPFKNYFLSYVIVCILTFFISFALSYIYKHIENKCLKK